MSDDINISPFDVLIGGALWICAIAVLVKFAVIAFHWAVR